ncbi:hypothetical protein [Actinoplanes utahensis]|nr:hypothetical protein [Actinoplanes utahensis]GIF33591.1 hypothetical protein Aut01nite_65770 [Actinoplanes utahensis]
MTTSRRLQIATILALFALAPLMGTIVKTVILWDLHGTTYHLVTGLAVLSFAAALSISLLIGLDSDLDDIPWAKLGIFVLLLFVGGLFGWARYLAEG